MGGDNLVNQGSNLKANADGLFSNPLLGLSMGLLEAGQSSRTPQTIGGGFAKGLGYASAMQRQREAQKQKEKEFESTNELRKVQADKIRREANLPFGGKMPPGEVGQEAWLEYIKNTQGEDSDLYKNALKARQFERDYKRTWMTRSDSLSKSRTFSLLPADEKRRLTATAVGMGYTSDEAARAFTNGKTLQDLADAKDINLQDVVPVYALQGEEIKNQRKRAAFVKELNYLDSVGDEISQKYSRRFWGYSPKQLWDAVKNEDPDQQGKFLAYRAVQPEISALRLKAANSQVGIQAIEEMQNKALANAQTFEPLVSGEARVAMNKYINEWISNASDIFNDTIESRSQITGQPNLKQKRKAVTNLSTEELLKIAGGG